MCLLLWFLKIRFRQALAVAAGGSSAAASLISVSGGCCGRKAGVCVAVPGLNGALNSVPGLPEPPERRPELRPSLSFPLLLRE